MVLNPVFTPFSGNFTVKSKKCYEAYFLSMNTEVLYFYIVIIKIFIKSEF